MRYPNECTSPWGIYLCSTFKFPLVIYASVWVSVRKYFNGTSGETRELRVREQAWGKGKRWGKRSIPQMLKCYLTTIDVSLFLSFYPSLLLCTDDFFRTIWEKVGGTIPSISKHPNMYFLKTCVFHYISTVYLLKWGT